MNRLTSQLSHTKLNSLQTKTLQSNLNTSVNLACNKCGKNLLDKYQFQTNSLASYSNQEISLNGCLSCAHYLPQCSVCLRLMKVNLAPNPLNVVSMPSQPLMTSRTQPILLQSPKVTYSNYSKRMSMPYRSPSQSDSSSNRNFFLEEITEYHRKEENNTVTKVETNNQAALVNRPGQIHSESLYILANSKIGNWFSWCQSCHHGGHIKHLIDWFKQNSKCPFLHCKCQCINLDCLF